MTRGNLSYVRLLAGGTSAEFVRMRDTDALGDDPAGAYTRSVRECAAAFARPGALRQVLDYPLGRVADDTLRPDLVTWISDHLSEIYDGLAESPVAAQSAHRFFAAPPDGVAESASRQERLLTQMGRRP